MSTLHNRAAEAAQRRELRRAIALSGLLHLVLGAAFYFAPPLMARSPELPGIITVDLVAMPALAGAAASRPPPAPAPEPIPATPTPPKPPPPPKREVVIPETPRREAKPKPKPKTPAKPPDPDPPPPRDAEVEYDDLLAELRAERGERPPAEVARVEEPAAPAAGGGGTVQVSPEVARWLRLADRHVKRFWVVPLGLQDAPLVVHLDVRLDASGALQGEPRITKRSGNPWFDEGAVRAVEKAAPLPAPPEAGTWPFVFRPEDLD